MSRRPLIAALVLSAFALAALAQVHDHAPPPAGAADAGDRGVAETGVAALSPDLRTLFRQEMAGLQGAMLELLPAVVAGEWENVAAVARRIQDGFVLAQQLTPAQRLELHERLPDGFLELDGEFHELAGGLAVAAHELRSELVPFYVYKLTDACVTCHSRHATERFPAFVTRPASPAHEH